MSEQGIHLIARGLVLHGDQLILCKAKGKDWYFLPGGHVEKGELAQEALLRELEEEIGAADYSVKGYIGISENMFQLQSDENQHEINIVFEVLAPKDLQIKSSEQHIDFHLFNKDKLNDVQLLPATLKNSITKWMQNGKPFHCTNVE